MMEPSEAERRAVLADLALVIFAAVRAALDGEAGYRRLVRWTEAMRAGEEPGVTLL